MTMTMQHPARPASRRPGFSLLEIMIAIMIMGLGMVMVATVFPVSLGMARDTVRSDMAMVVADAAIATLKARVPGKSILVNPEDTYSHAILAPNMGYIMRNQPDQIIDANSNYDVMSAFQVSGWSDWSGIESWNYPFSPPPPVVAGEQPARVFTEKSGWDIHQLLSTSTDNVSLVIPAQNIRNDGQLVVEIPPVPVISPIKPFPRLHLADRVYPAPLIYDATRQLYQDPRNRGTESNPYYIDPQTNTSVNPPSSWNLIEVNASTGAIVDTKEHNYLMNLLAEGDPAADRPPTYYSWTAIHSRCPNGYGTTDDGNMLAAVVVTHRLSVNSRYARQKEIEGDSDTDVYNVNFNTSTPVDQLLRPEPDDNPETDMVFPVPWLVMFNEVNLAEGEITCTAEVARLLPRGSFFIVAAGQEELYAGVPHQVIDSIWDPSMLPDDPASPRASLKIAPKAGSTAELTNLAVWVFPPPILTTATAIRQSTNSADIQFGERSPVIGVAMEALK